MIGISDTQEFKVIDLKDTKNVISDTSRNELEYVINQFKDELNKERVGTKYKPLSFIAVKMKLLKIKELRELYSFLSVCRDSKNRQGSFSRAFFGILKAKKLSTGDDMLA